MAVLSVCPSVTLVNCVDIARHILKLSQSPESIIQVKQSMEKSRNFRRIKCGGTSETHSYYATLTESHILVYDSSAL